MQDSNYHDISIGIKGRFKLMAVKADGSGARKLAEFDNLILNSGLDYFCSNQDTSALAYVRVGSGSTPPAPSQTDLVSQISGAGDYVRGTAAISSSAPYWFSRTRTWRFAAGAAAGNIAEIGVGWATAGDTLFSRALVLDQNGNPTTVTVLNDEFLDVTYTLTCYPSAEDSRTTLNLAGSSYEVMSRISYAGVVNQFVQTGNVLTQHPLRYMEFVAAAAGGAGPITGGPDLSQALVVYPTVTRQPYTAGSFISEVALRFGLEDINVSGGVGSLLLSPSSFCRYQIEFTPKLPKTNTQVFTLNFRLTFTRR